jgi:hypothetical protein
MMSLDVVKAFPDLKASSDNSLGGWVISPGLTGESEPPKCPQDGQTSDVDLLTDSLLRYPIRSGVGLSTLYKAHISSLCHPSPSSANVLSSLGWGKTGLWGD